MAAGPGDSWSSARTEAFLAETVVPLRLACNGRSGHPVLASLWFLPEGGAVWCATQAKADIVGHLRRDPRCAFEVSPETPPYRGLRGQGEARIEPERGGEILERLLERYAIDPESSLARWLSERTAREVAIAIEPHSCVGWDYGDRMHGAVRDEGRT